MSSTSPPASPEGKGKGTTQDKDFLQNSFSHEYNLDNHQEKRRGIIFDFPQIDDEMGLIKEKDGLPGLESLTFGDSPTRFKNNDREH